MTGGHVVYTRNNAAYTSPVSATYPMKVDASLLTVGGSFANAIFSTVGSGGAQAPPAQQWVAGCSYYTDCTDSQVFDWQF